MKNKIIIALGLLFLTTTILNPFVIINSGEKGVSKIFGKVSSNIKNEGLNIRNIFLGENIIKVNVKPQAVEGDALTYTKDNQPIDIKFKIIYSIPENDLQNTIAKYNNNPMNNFAYSKILDAIKAVGGKYTATEFVVKREIVKKDLVELARTVVINEQTKTPSVNIIDIPLTNVDFDDQYETAIKNKQVMQQKAQQKEYELQAARRQSEITIVNAEAEAKAIRVKAEALKSSPQLVEFEKVNMMKEKWDGQLPQYIGGNDKMLFSVK